MKVVSLLQFVTLTSVAAALPPPTAPEVQTLPPYTRKDAVLKRIRYGPHKLKRAVGSAADPKGIKTTIVGMSVKKPCDDCTLLMMNGGIQYADGTEAAAPRVYLHHAAIINTGPQAKDGTCGRPAYDLFFSSGNERSTIIYNNPNSTLNSGYYIHPSDNFLLQSEVINNEFDDKEVWVYMNYEYIPGKLPEQRQTKVAWLSAAAPPCASKMDPKALLGALDPKNDNGEEKLSAGEMYPPNDKKFTLKSEPWISPWTGNFIALGGHIHDGGINAEIYQNGKLLCDSRATYALSNSSHMSTTHSSTVSRHLVSMSGCRSGDAVKAGDTFHVVVNYDFEQNPGMRDKNDKLMPVMAAATLFIGAI